MKKRFIIFLAIIFAVIFLVFQLAAQGIFDFSISASPISGSVAQGSSISTLLSATLISGTSAPVSFSASGLPIGATIAFSPTACLPTCSSTATITTALTTPLGSYTITFSATDGTITRSVTFSLTVISIPNVTGWGWIGADNCDGIVGCASQTNPLGWISFNCSNTGICGTVLYGVNVDYAAANLNDTISGYAWIGDDTSGFGWLNFNSTLTPGIAQDNFPARYDLISGNIVGWAPVVANAATVSWIHFCGSCSYSSHINSDGTIGTSGGTDRYAWAGSSSDADFSGLGWIDLKPTVGTPVTLPPNTFNQPPNDPGTGGESGVTTPSVGPTADDNPGEACVNMVRPTFSWTYFDSGGDDQSAFQIELYANQTLTPPIAFDTGKTLLTCASGSICQYSLSTPLNFNSDYFWRVRVWDINNFVSGWSIGETFITPKHATDFTWSPAKPSVNETVTFTETSTFPNGGATAISSRIWTIPDFNYSGLYTNASSPTRGIFTVKGTKSITFNSTDNGTPSTTCSRIKSLDIKIPLPKIKEVAP